MKENWANIISQSYNRSARNWYFTTFHICWMLNIPFWSMTNTQLAACSFPNLGQYIQFSNHFPKADPNLQIDHPDGKFMLRTIFPPFPNHFPNHFPTMVSPPIGSGRPASPSPRLCWSLHVSWVNCFRCFLKRRSWREWRGGDLTMKPWKTMDWTIEQLGLSVFFQTQRNTRLTPWQFKSLLWNCYGIDGRLSLMIYLLFSEGTPSKSSSFSHAKMSLSKYLGCLRLAYAPIHPLENSSQWSGWAIFWLCNRSPTDRKSPLPGSCGSPTPWEPWEPWRRAQGVACWQRGMFFRWFYGINPVGEDHWGGLETSPWPAQWGNPLISSKSIGQFAMKIRRSIGKWCFFHLFPIFILCFQTSDLETAASVGPKPQATFRSPRWDGGKAGGEPAVTRDVSRRCFGPCLDQDVLVPERSSGSRVALHSRCSAQ